MWSAWVEPEMVKKWWWGPKGFAVPVVEMDVREGGTSLVSMQIAKKVPRIPKMAFYHSKNDPIVPFAHMELYAKALPNAIVHELDGDEHCLQPGAS